MVGRVLRGLALAAVVIGLSCGNVGSKPKVPEKRLVVVAELVRHVYIEPAFPQAEIAMIIEAAERWETATRGALRFRIHVAEPLPEKFDEGNLVYVTRANSRDMIARVVEKMRGPGGGGIILGWTFQHRAVSTIILFVDRIDSNRVFTQLTTHELGHALGIQHLDSRHSAVMYPFMDGATTCPTRLDLEALCGIYGCDPDFMAPCEP